MAAVIKEEVPDYCENISAFDSFECEDMKIEDGTEGQVHRYRKPQQEGIFHLPKDFHAFNSNHTVEAHFPPHKAPEKITCNFCEKTFKAKSNLLRHVTVHFSVKPFSCSLCNKQFKTKALVQFHFNEVHNKKYECGLCEKLFGCHERIISHINTHTPTARRIYYKLKSGLLENETSGQQTIFWCHFCQIEIFSEQWYNEHISKHEQLQFFCPQGCQFFNSQSELDFHISTHKTELECDVCHKIFQKRHSIMNHLAVHFPTQTHSCYVCRKEFKSELSLKVHLSTIHQVQDCSKLSSQVWDDTTNEEFLCHICCRTFREPMELKIHISEHNQKFVDCDLCGKTFRRKALLRYHMFSHFPAEYLTCDSCKQSFKSIESFTKHSRGCNKVSEKLECSVCKIVLDGTELKAHMATHGNEKKLSCHICNEVFQKWLDLRKHVSQHNNRHVFSCDLCVKTFLSKNGLRNHIYFHFPEEYLTCSVCRKTFSAVTTFQKHVRDCVKGNLDSIRPNQTQYINRPNTLCCDLCKRTFQSKHGLRQHMFSHFPQEYLTCEGCKGSFKTVKLFTMHLQECYLIKDRHNCSVCKKVFMDSSDLKSHLETHNTQNKFHCHFCNKILKNSLDFKKHIFQHNNPNLFKCELCLKGFHTKEGLRHHVFSHFPEEYLTCGFCNKTHDVIETFKRHVRDCKKKMRMAEPDQIVHKCDLCGKTFRSKHGVRDHMFTHFPEEYLTCSGCNINFKSRNYFVKHLRECYKVKSQHECPVCEKLFLSSSELKTHVEQHKNAVATPKPQNRFRCQVCKNTFKNAIELKIHVTKCNIQNLLQCDLCVKTFITKDGLRNHMFFHFPEEYLTCGLCKKMFNSMRGFRQHKQSCKEEKVVGKNKNRFKCDLCKKILLSKHGLRYHIYSHFPKEFFTCSRCKEWFKSKCFFSRHSKKCSPNKKEVTPLNSRLYSNSQKGKSVNSVVSNSIVRSNGDIKGAVNTSRDAEALNQHVAYKPSENGSVYMEDDKESLKYLVFEINIKNEC